MPIQTGDVVLLKSAVMDDVPEGGGPPTGNVIADGVSNAIFPDISGLDRAKGRFNLRKIVAAIRTDDVEHYLGATVILADPPKDPRVSVTLFATKSNFDVRSEAASRVEAYLNKGPELPGFLYEDHLAGQRVVQIFQRTSDPLPTPGKTFVLVQNEGRSNQIEQYVRATRVSSIERTFTYGEDTDYKAAIVSVEISDALRADLTGSPAARSFTRIEGATKLRDTVVADAGSYCGAVPLAAPVAVGDFSVSATSIFTQLVPSAQSESPITGQSPFAAIATSVSGTAPVSITTSVPWSNTQALVLPGGARAGSITVKSDGVTITDAGGRLLAGGVQIGTIDYPNGVLTASVGSYNGNKTISYTPAAYPLRMPQSSEIPVTAEGRSLSYTGVLPAPAARGTLSVAYRSQRRWSVISDNGAGQLRGIDSSYGAGTYNPDTSDYVLTLGALPDVGSSIVLTWGVPTQETVHPSVALKLSQTIAINAAAGESAQPGSIVATWEDGATQYTASVNAAGVLSGAATGRYDLATGYLTLSPSVLPAPGTNITINYRVGAQSSESFSHPSRVASGKLEVIASSAMSPGSVVVRWNTLTDLAALGVYTDSMLRALGVAGLPTLVDPINTATDDGAGNLLRDGAVIGTVDYGTGHILWNPDVVLSVPRPQYGLGSVARRNPGGDASFWRINYQSMQYVPVPSMYPNDDSGSVTINYLPAAATNVRAQTVPFAIDFSLLPGIAAPVVPGSVALQPSAGGPLQDNGQGVLRELTSAGLVQRGTVDYITGRATITSWPTGSGPAVQRVSCVTTLGEGIASAFVCRTAVAPLRPGSLTFQFAKDGGGSAVVPVGIDGVINAPGVVGTVDVETGLIRIGFGNMVLAAGNEAEPWYHATRVNADGYNFKPAPVMASTLKYSGVAYSYLPLNAELLGIDPVRLPTDGRVPIFRAGGTAVLGHTSKITRAVANGDVVNCGRVRLSRVRLIGADGVVLNSGYTADLEAGTVTVTNIGTGAAAWPQPVTIEHRIEDMATVREIDINGTISLNSAVSHAYPLGSYVSSAIEVGDVFARVNTVFSQATWTVGRWLDAVDGSVPAARFNHDQFPITVTNRGAVTERWLLRMLSSTNYEVIGEHVGVIAVGDTSNNCSPINAAAAAPYFTVNWRAFGNNWVPGNVIRFNTVLAGTALWLARTIQPGPETVTNDSFTVLVRGDVDNPI